MTVKDGFEAFRWTKEHGLETFGDLPGGRHASRAHALSRDGSNIAGESAVDGGVRGVLWTAPFVLSTIDDSRSNIIPAAISADGKVVTGSSGDYAFRWSELDGFQILAGEPPNSAAGAPAVSADGLVVAGSENAQQGYDVIRWVFDENGFERISLGTLASRQGGRARTSGARDISDDGNIIVGRSVNIDDQMEAFLWRNTDGGFGEMVGLGFLPGETQSEAADITGDGSIIVGKSGSQLFIWDAERGMRSLNELFVKEYGLGPAIDGWILQEVTGISDDGTILVGNGENPNGQGEGWRADIGAPSLLADGNFDGKVDLADFAILKSHFGAGIFRSEGDFNDDDFVDILDYEILKSTFGQAVPSASNMASANSPVPEPATGVYLSCGLLGLGAAGIRQGRVGRRQLVRAS